MHELGNFFFCNNIFKTYRGDHFIVKVHSGVAPAIEHISHTVYSFEQAHEILAYQRIRVM